MMPKIKISVENVNSPEWVDKVLVFLNALLISEKHENWILSVVFCDNSFIQDLNLRFRNIDSPTDVLSFENGGIVPAKKSGNYFLAGDIIISLPFLIQNSKNFNVSPNEELKRLLIHGVLHLAGNDHLSNDFSTEPMLIMQEKILEKMNKYDIIC